MSIKGEITCYICGEIGHVARDCKQENAAGSSNRRNDECYKCGESGHFARYCSKGKNAGELACYRCGEVGHVARDCKQGENAGSSNRKIGDCYTCGESGHFARDCSRSKDAPKEKSCFKCGEAGHIARECKTTGNIKNIECFKCGELGHFSRECLNEITGMNFEVQDLREKLPSDLRSKLSSGRFDTVMAQPFAHSKNIDHGKVRLLQDEIKNLEKMLNNFSENRREYNIGSVVDTCSRNLNNDIQELFRSSNRRHGKDEEERILRARVDSLRPLEMVFFRSLKRTLPDSDVKHAAALAQHFPRLLAFMGFNYEEIRSTCIAFKISSPMEEGVSKLAHLFKEMLAENGGVPTRLWPSTFSTMRVSETLINHFGKSSLC